MEGTKRARPVIEEGRKLQKHLAKDDVAGLRERVIERLAFCEILRVEDGATLKLPSADDVVAMDGVALAKTSRALQVKIYKNT